MRINAVCCKRINQKNYAYRSGYSRNNSFNDTVAETINNLSTLYFPSVFSQMIINFIPLFVCFIILIQVGKMIIHFQVFHYTKLFTGLRDSQIKFKQNILWMHTALFPGFIYNSSACLKLF